VLMDGEHFTALAPSRDHKRVFDHDQGPNTGGMGAYSSDDMMPPAVDAQIREQIIKPTMVGLASDTLAYCGFLYFGLMLTAKGPRVLEFNCRLGDPETQALLPRLDGDLGQILNAAAQGNLDKQVVTWKPGGALAVVMTSGGYPGKFEVGKEITGLETVQMANDVAVFHSGTKAERRVYYTCSGRVLAVSAVGHTVAQARHTAYNALQGIHFSGAHFRTDIGEAEARPNATGT
jgi:phosphoribosylamine--glycine ligase